MAIETANKSAILGLVLHVMLCTLIHHFTEFIENVMQLTTKEQADIVVLIRKYILDHVNWQPMGNRFKLRARVGIEEIPDFLIGQNFELEIVGNIGRKNHGFSLLLNKIVLRRYDYGSVHTNTDGSKVGILHKHFWTPEYNTANAYVPDDIDSDTSVNEQFYAFCRECNVEIRGSYQRLLAGGPP